MEYREAMGYLDECGLAAILVAQDKRIAEHNANAEKLLCGHESLVDQPLELIVKFLDTGQDGEVYANTGLNRYVKQCPTPPTDNLPTGSRLIVFRDATKEILADMYEAVINKFRDSVIVCDSYSRIIMLNESAETMDSLSLENVQGLPLGSVYHMVNDSILVIPKAIEERKALPDIRQKYRTVDDKEVDIVASSYPILKGNKIIGGFAIMQDWSRIDDLNRRIMELQGKLLERTPPVGTPKAAEVLPVRYGFSDIIHGSPAMKKTLLECRQAAQSDAYVMIHGEAGTGKELVAQAIHAASSRSDGPFLAARCAGMPEALQDTMLFGVEADAAAGTKRRRGLLEQANGGSLLLDDVTAISPALQAKLARVLQDGRLRPIGGDEEVVLNARILTTINPQPGMAIDDKRLRRDLYFLLGVVTLSLPPLRERRDDVPLLVSHFIKEIGAKISSSVQDIEAGTLEILLAYDWPGNVRELHHAIEYALHAAPKGTGKLAPSNLPPHIVTSVSGDAYPGSDLPDGATSLPQILDRLEHRMLMKALHENGGNISRTARTLGMTRQNLQYRLKKAGVKVK